MAECKKADHKKGIKVVGTVKLGIKELLANAPLFNYANLFTIY